ncbi:MAG TPA: hypothetical protein PL033_03985 [Candidatus Brocadiia bacterium]|nr:hypothetical protein [Candidatus Brocadiia bacterium]
MGVIPVAAILAIAVIALITWQGIGLIRHVLGREKLGAFSCLLMLFLLGVLSGIACIAIKVSASLGHSRTAMETADAVCLLIVVLVVGFPALGMLVYRRYQPKSAVTNMGIVKRMAVVYGITCSLLLMSSIEYDFGIQIPIEGRNREDIGVAFAEYELRPAPVFSDTRGVLARTNQHGQYNTSSGFHLRLPLSGLTVGARRKVSIYVPVYHNSCAFKAGRFGNDNWNSPWNYFVTRRWELSDESAILHAKPVVYSMQLFLNFRDLTDNPELWYKSLKRQIYSIELAGLHAERGVKREFVAALKRDYADFAQKYENVERDYRRGDGKAPEDDWVQWDGQPKTWRFFLDIPWYGKTMEQKLAELEAELTTDGK